MRFGRTLGGLAFAGLMAVGVLTSAGASAPALSVSEVAPGVYSVKNLPIAEDGSESSVAAEKVAQFRANRAGGWSSAQVEASATVHADLGAEGAESLFVDVFGSQVGDLLEDPASALRSTEEVVAFRDDFTAVIDPAGPEDRALVVSTAPMRTDDGKLPNLGLESNGALIGVKEPTTVVEFSKDPAEGIEIPQTGVGIAFDEVRTSAPEGSIVAVDGSGSGEAAFYPNALTDTDLIAAPLANGVETFAHLRSEDSPEAIKMPIDAPDGGSVSSSEDGGAVVTDTAGDPVAQVYPPTAVDAKGETVPVTMSVDGDSLVLDVPHRGLGFAYPILVDPVVETWNWWTGTDTTHPGWQFVKIGDEDYQGSTYCFQVTIDSCGAPSSGGGLFVYAGPNKQYTQSSQARWRFVPPGSDSYIAGATVTSWRYKKGGAPNGNPFAYWGIATGYLWNDYQITDLDSGGNNRTIQGGVGAREFAMGLTTNSTMTLPAGTANWRYNRVGAVQFSLSDETPPTLGPVSQAGLNIPASGWINQAQINDPRSIHASASDAGLGVKRIVVLGAAAGGGWYSDEWNAGCTGGFKSLCWGVTPTGGVDIPVRPSALPEGVNTLSALAIDAKDTNSTAHTFEVKIDRTAPDLTLADQFAVATESEDRQSEADEVTEQLARPTYDLTVQANDSAGGNSGVRSVRIRMNPVPGDLSQFDTVAAHDFTCSSTCPSTGTYNWSLDLSDVLPGEYLVNVTVKDKAGNERARNVSFRYAPGTGEADEYAMETIFETDDATMRVNIANGNLFYKTNDITVPGSDVDLTVDRSYNSQSLETDSDWGEGWTSSLAEEIDMPSTPGAEAVLTDIRGTATGGIEIPTIEGDDGFASEIQQIVTKTEDGVVLTDGTGDSTYFDEDGLQTAETTINGSQTLYGYDANDNVEEITTINMYAPAENASATVERSGKLVEEISTDGGNIEYHYVQDHLASTDSPSGSENYNYDNHELLEDLNLADGTSVHIDYDADKRVSQVVLNEPGQPPLTWSFVYSTYILINGTTTVTSPAGIPVIYSIGSDGSVFSSRISAPSISLTLSGTLYAAKNSVLNNSGVYGLTTQATGGSIDKYMLLADGIVLDSRVCSPSCSTLNESFDVDRASLPSGEVKFEAVVERTTGEVRSERFSVNVPTIPEPENQGWTVPSLDNALEFRQNFGLNTDPTIVSAIQSDPNNWYNAWGVPLTASELSLLTTRERYIEEASTLIEGYAGSHPSNYAGWYVDASGNVRVGILTNIASVIDSLRSQFSAPSKLLPMDEVPTLSESSLESLSDRINTDITQETIPAWTEADFAYADEESNQVVVLVKDDKPGAESYLRSVYGTSLTTNSQPFLAYSVWSSGPVNPLRAGNGFSLLSDPQDRCSVGFGYRKRVGSVRARATYRYFFITARHCVSNGVGNATGTPVFVRTTQVGKVADDYPGFAGRRQMDVMTVRLNDKNRVPCVVRSGGNGKLKYRVSSSRSNPSLHRGILIRSSGIGTGVKRGVIRKKYTDASNRVMLFAKIGGGPGDSGGPVYIQPDPTGGPVSAVGLVSGGIGKRNTFITPVGTAENVFGGTIVDTGMGVCQGR